MSDLFHPVCAGASTQWHEKCPRCGAKRQDVCGDNPAYIAQANRLSDTRATPRYIKISRQELDDAVASASEHIAPCGHNELENIYAAVEAALASLKIEIAPPEPAGLMGVPWPMDDFAGFSNATLATFCERWPGTNEARAAKAELITRKCLPYSEMCRKPWECLSVGRCPLDPNCAD